MRSSPSSQALVTSRLLPELSNFIFPSLNNLMAKSPAENLLTFANIQKSSSQFPEFETYLFLLVHYLNEQVNFHDIPEQHLPIVKDVVEQVNAVVNTADQDNHNIQEVILFNEKCALYFFEDGMKFYGYSLALQHATNKFNYPKMIAVFTSFTKSIRRLYGSMYSSTDKVATVNLCDVQVTHFIGIMEKLSQYADGEDGTIVANDMAVMISLCFDLIINLLQDFHPSHAWAHYDELRENFKENRYFSESIKRVNYEFESDGSEEEELEEDELAQREEDIHELFEGVTALSKEKELNLIELSDLSYFHPTVAIKDEATIQLLLKLYDKALTISLEKSQPYQAMSFLKDYLILLTEQDEPLDMMNLASLMQNFSAQIVKGFQPLRFDLFYQAVALYTDIFILAFSVITSSEHANDVFVKAALEGFKTLMNVDFTCDGDSFKYPFFYLHSKLLMEMFDDMDGLFPQADFPGTIYISNNCKMNQVMINEILKEIASKERLKFDKLLPPDIQLSRMERYKQLATAICGDNVVAVASAFSNVTIEEYNSPRFASTSPIKQHPVKPLLVNNAIQFQQALNLVYTNLYNMKIILNAANLAEIVKRYALLYNIFEAFKALNYALETHLAGAQESTTEKQIIDIKHLILYGGNQIATIEEVTSLCHKLVAKLPAQVTPSPIIKPLAYRNFKDQERKQLAEAFDFKEETAADMSNCCLHIDLKDFHTEYKICNLPQSKVKDKMHNIANKEMLDICQIISRNLDDEEDIEGMFDQLNFFELQALKVLLIMYGEVSFHYSLPKPELAKKLDQLCFTIMKSFYHNVYDTSGLSLKEFTKLSSTITSLKNITIDDKWMEESKNENEIPIAPSFTS